MKNSPIKSRESINFNPIVSVVSPRSFSELTLSINGKAEDILEMDRSQRVYHFRIRQQWIVNNCKIIAKNKANPTEKSSKIVGDLLRANKQLSLDIDNLRYAVQFLKESPLLDTYVYQDYMKSIVSEEIIISNEPLKYSDEQLISEFTSFINNQKTDCAISLLKPILANHLYSVRKMAVKD